MIALIMLVYQKGRLNMKKSFTVMRIFPLGSYQNLQLTASVEYTGEEWKEVEERADDEAGLVGTDVSQFVLDRLVADIYTQAYRHQTKLEEVKTKETTEEKLQVFGG